MIKLLHIGSLLSLLVVSLCLAVADPKLQQTADEQLVAADIGREDPFGVLAEKKEPIVPQQTQDESVVVEQKPPLFVETVTLKFLNASSLRGAIESMSSEYGSISIDTKSNSLIVCDTNDNLPRILAEIRKADKVPEQIMIEVVILDVQLEDDAEIGVNWDRLFNQTREESYKQTFISTLDTAGVTGGDFGILKANIYGTIHALQKTRDIEILASPRALVVSGEEAQIQTVEEIPYKEISDTSAGGASALTSTEFREVGVTLKVKATVTDEKKILMVIESEQSINTGEEGIEDVPIIDKRSAQTTLLMDDGQVVAMGGLRRKELKYIENKIPILGDLPLVGMFFSDDQKIYNEYELLVLISPHIHKGEPLSDEQMEKFNELRERPMLEMPDDSRIFLRVPASILQYNDNIEQKKDNTEQGEKKQPSEQENPDSAEELKVEQKRQPSRQRYPTSVEELKKALSSSSKP